MSTKTIYISIGNSDDRLTQVEWARFYRRVALDIRDNVTAVHGAWVSEPASAWQNACWCVEIQDNGSAELLKHLLSLAAEDFRQDSIAWAEVSHTEFIGPVGDGDRSAS